MNPCRMHQLLRGTDETMIDKILFYWENYFWKWVVFGLAVTYVAIGLFLRWVFNR